MANLTISGDTSGSVTLAAPAIAGSPVVTLPSSTGTLALAGGQLIRAPQVLTSGTSYTTPENCTAIYVEAVGGGGGGGGVNGSGESTGAGGGGSGGYCAKYFSVSGNTSYSYAIGAGGAGGVSSANGTSGSNTTFTVGNTTITAGFGTFGIGASNGPQGNNGVAFSAGGTGGVSINGDINATGSPGQHAIMVGFANGTSGTMAGSGGPSFFSGGGRAGGIQEGSTSRGFPANATAGQFGSGGGGSGSTTTVNGGDGGNGIIRIWEFT